MTKDKKNFRFKSDRERSIVFAYIRELKAKHLNNAEIVRLVKKEFRISPHRRTVESWIKGQSCRFNEKWVAEDNLMRKWQLEVSTPKQFLTPEEIQLEEMFMEAESRGLMPRIKE